MNFRLAKVKFTKNLLLESVFQQIVAAGRAEADIDREKMLDFEKRLGKCKRAMIFAIIVIIIFISLIVAGFFTQDIIISNTITDSVRTNTAYEKTFIIFPLKTPVKIDINKDNPGNVCIITTTNYEVADTAIEIAQKSIHYESDATKFSWEGELEPGKYLIWIQSTNATDTIKMNITIKYIKPIFYYLAAFVGLICLLLVLRVFLKSFRIGKIKENRRKYLETPVPKSNHNWSSNDESQQDASASNTNLYGSSGGSSNSGHTTGGGQSTAIYQQSPEYNAADLAYFNQIDTPHTEEEIEPVYEQKASKGINPFEGLNSMMVEDPHTKEKTPAPELEPIYESDEDEDENIYLSIDDELAPKPITKGKSTSKGKKESISTKKVGTSGKERSSKRNKGKGSKPNKEESENIEDTYLSMDDFD